MARILLVDDDRQMLEAMGAYLGWYGFEVELLEDSSRAIGRLEAGKFDLVISGAFTSPVGGYELCENIRKSENAAVRGVKIILIAPEEPELGRFLILKKLGADFMNKYEDAGTWRGKIDAALRFPPPRLILLRQGFGGQVKEV